MIKRFKKMIALGVIMTFLTLLPISSLSLPAQQASNFIEKEQQVSYQSTQKNVLPVLLGIAAQHDLVIVLGIHEVEQGVIAFRV